jgi:hypothetical protein
MEGSPNGAIRPNFDLSRMACMKRIGGIVFTGWALGAAIWALPASAEEKWKGTIGEPLRASSNQAIELANHLSAIGARFYGSWSCPACFRQMNLFGQQAGSTVPYVECRQPKKRPQQAADCESAAIRAFPTWVMPDGRRREGLQSLDALSSWSGLP